jgi:lysozyme
MKLQKRILLRLVVTIVVVVILTSVIVLLGRRGSVLSPGAQEMGTPLPGVNVSSHNAPIDWGPPAKLGLRFVIARATEGDSRVDTRYSSFKRKAKAAGLAFTAFHYARPDKAHGDALREADLMLRVAKLRSGDLVPVLDLEEPGHLGVKALQAWVRAWLEEVTAKLGAKPMIYTNAGFWRTRMGDTAEFADEGYKLWIASWRVDQPVVPAGNWGGHGWTMWQTATCGQVLGIKACIDTDLYAGRDLSLLAIP